MARRFAFRMPYLWAPGGLRPADFSRFLSFAYRTWCWPKGEVYYYAKCKPDFLRKVYDTWRIRHAA